MKTMKYDVNSVDDQDDDEGGGAQVANACLQCFKVCFKKKANFGLEDLFWLSFLILIIILSIVKSTIRIGWSQFIYVICGSVIGLIVVYISASIINKLCFDDAATAHWNAHARFTQAAMAARLQQEEHKVTVIAPPKMGGAKLNIFYTVGDVPIVAPLKGIHGIQPVVAPPATPTENSCPAQLPTTTTTITTIQPTATGATTMTTVVESGAGGVGQTAQASHNKNISRNGGSASGGQSDPSSKYELPDQTPSYAKTSATLYEEPERF